MFAALFYLQFQSAKNRVLLRFRRLKQPKYLLGGIVGALYFYAYFFRYLLGSPGRNRGLPFSASANTQMMLEGLGASVLLIAVLLAWLLPHNRAALTFSEAEVDFLFPAPISRRGLIHFKLLRSQAAILFTTLILMLVTNRFGGKFWIHAAGWWLILSNLNLHFLGSSFARTRLLDRGITNTMRRLLVLGLAALVSLAVVIWAYTSLPRFSVSQRVDLNEIQQYFHRVLTSGPLPWLLYPFRLVVKPYLAPDLRAFAWALLPVLGLLLLQYWWVARADVSFEEASLEASRRLAQRIAAARSGQLRNPERKIKGRRAPFVMSATGSPVVALLWKNLISAGQIFTPRLWILFALTAVMISSCLAQFSQNSNLVSAGGIAVAMVVVWSLFIGPQILRQDLRQDLAVADILKMYPIRGWELALGELLTPVTILTGVQWVLLLMSGALLLSAPPPYLSRALTLGLGFGAALIVPMLNLIILQIPNAAVVLFPAWFQPGKERAHGFEVTGQRIIAIFAQLVVFIISLIPAAVAFIVVFLIGDKVVGRTLAISAASIVAATVLGVEGALGVALLGKLFERLDLSTETSA
jgi:ABC-2 type transport system permease protein